MVYRSIQNITDKISSAGEGLKFSLGAQNVPDHLYVRPVDCWPGNPEDGEHVLHGRFVLGDDEIDFDKTGWSPVSISQKWLDYINSFNWLRDLRSFGAPGSKDRGSLLIADWIAQNTDRKHAAFHPALVAQRVCQWISHYDYFCAGADEGFEDQFFLSLSRQAHFLYTQAPSRLDGLDLLHVLKGIIYCGVALGRQETYLEKALMLLEREIQTQTGGDGMHISRSPKSLLDSLMIFLDIRGALNAAGLPAQEKLQHAIDKMGPALRFFMYGDRRLAVMHGAQEGRKDILDSALAQAGVRGKILNSLPGAMYERVSQGRSLLMFDGGKSPAWPFDQAVHSAPLSFEFAYGKERVFVACGTHPVSEDWCESLRASAAHNTLTIDHRNICEIRADGHLGRKVKESSVKREDGDAHALIEGAHDAYVPLNGLTHRRRLFLCEQGHDLRGEDCLQGLAQSSRQQTYSIRFHLHPRVLVSLVQNGREALLRLSNGVGWRFHHQGGSLSLENSIYIGSGSHPRKTKQLVIKGQIYDRETRVKWALQREGL